MDSLDERVRFQDPSGYYFCVSWEEYAPGHSHMVYNDHAPGCRYCRACWPPRGRGRGEDLYSPRRIKSLLKALEACRLRWMHQLTYEQIARRLGYGARVQQPTMPYGA